MNHYIADKWHDILVFNKLDSHEKIWALEADWFEEPNQRRGGLSGVSRIELLLPRGGKVGVFLKRQEDHVSKSLFHPIKGFSTFVREFKNIRAFENEEIPSLETVYFESWKESGHQRAILMTVELNGYEPLSSDNFQPGGKFVSSREQKLKLLKRLAELMQKMHKRNFQHNCFYLKHIFAKSLPNMDVDLRVIDLEKVKKPLIKKRVVFRDLYTLHRHSHNWSGKDKLKFYKLYRCEDKLSKASKDLWREIEGKVERKSKKT